MKTWKPISFILCLIFFSSFVEASVDNMGSLITQGYGEQAKTYKKMQKYFAAKDQTRDQRSEEQIQTLKSLAKKQSKPQGFQIRLVSVRHSE